jgi:hypothetical protein
MARRSLARIVHGSRQLATLKHLDIRAGLVGQHGLEAMAVMVGERQLRGGQGDRGGLSPCPLNTTTSIVSISSAGTCASASSITVM